MLRAPGRVAFITLLQFTATFGAYGSSVAYIGDSQSSHSLGLYEQLKSSLEKSGHKIQLAHSICGARIEDYILGGVKGKCSYVGLTHLRMGSEKRPIFVAGPGSTISIGDIPQGVDTVIVQLGDNHLDSLRQLEKQSTLLVADILSRHKNCIWIGPAALPNRKEYRKTNEKKRAANRALSKTLAAPIRGRHKQSRNCLFIDSFALTESNPPPTFDGLHYSNYHFWSAAIEKSLLDLLSKSSSH